MALPDRAHQREWREPAAFEAGELLHLVDCNDDATIEALADGVWKVEPAAHGFRGRLLFRKAIEVASERSIELGERPDSM